MLKRMISLFLCAAMILTMLPTQAIALEIGKESTEVILETEPAEKTTAPIDAVTEPTEETTAPTEEEIKPTKETVAPTEAETEPTEETAVPTEATEPIVEEPEPTEETTAPTEAVPEPTEETITPVEETDSLEEQENWLELEQKSMLAGSSAIASGTCGDNLTWILDSDGVLTVSGNGALDTYLFFSDQRIKKVFIEEGITEIGHGAFNYCHNLLQITVDDDNMTYSSADGVLFNKDQSTLIACPGGKSGSYIIPQGVTTIEEEAFVGCRELTSIFIPEGVTSIKDYAFGWCHGLTTITFPKSLRVLGDGVCDSCLRLSTVSILNGLTTIPEGAFSFCDSLTNIEIPDSVTSIGHVAFSDCRSLAEITIPRNVDEIGIGAFAWCPNLTSIRFEGDAPEPIEYPSESVKVFEEVTATAYYPTNNPTWTEEVMQDYGGNLTWKPCPSFPYSEETPSQELAEKLSLYSMLAYSESEWNGSVWTKGDDTNALVNQLTEDGYDELQSYYYSTKDIGPSNHLTRKLPTAAGENTSPFVLGHRKVNYNNKIVDQIVVVVRGTYNKEWYGNFDMTGTFYDASVDTHWSFEKAADSLHYHLDKYISKLEAENNLKNQDIQIVVTGHSRGAAVSNLLATWLTDIRDGKKASGTDIGSVYAYTFATPNVAESEKILQTNYSNIHNYCFTDDFVANLPLEAWGWGKYGNTYWATAADLKNKPYYFYHVKIHHNQALEYNSSYTENIVKTMISATEQAGIRDNGINNYYDIERFIGLGTKTTIYQFIRKVLGGAMQGILSHLNESLTLVWLNTIAEFDSFVDGHFRALADNLVDKLQSQPALLSTHQCYSYYEAIRMYHKEFSLSALTETGYDATPYDLVRPYSNLSNCDPNQVAVIQAFLLQSITDEESGTVIYNHELLGWDVDDISTWLGVTWYDGDVIVIDMKYGSVVGDLDLSAFPEIQRANFEYCNLSSLKATKCSDLAELYCDGNWLTELDLTGLENLINLNCANNHLTELDVLDCISLEQLICNGNEILMLDLSKSTQLHALICQDNYLDPNDLELKEKAAEIIAAGGTAEYSAQNVPPVAIFAENDVACLLAIANTGTNNEILEWNLEDPSSWNQVRWIKEGICYYLEGVDFTNLGLTGEAAFDNCTHLEYLLLDNNRFTGISVDSCTALTTLWCERNFLQGTVLEAIDVELSLTNTKLSYQLSEMVLNPVDISALDHLVASQSLAWDSSEYVVNEALTWVQNGEVYDLVEMDLSSAAVSGTLDLTTFQNLKSLNGTGEGVTKVVLPECIMAVYDSAFQNCVNLKTIVFTGGVPQFDDNAFKNIAAEAAYPASISAWNKTVMQNYGGVITWVPYGGVENQIIISESELDGQVAVWIDGNEYTVNINGGMPSVDLPDSNAKTMVVYTYGESNGKPYPLGMKVWTLSNADGFYTAARVKEFDDMLGYEGCSIRITGKQGIRIITSIDEADKAALTGNGLAGYSLKEYGTAIAWADQLSSKKPLVLGKSYVRHNYAYSKENGKDPIYDSVGGRMQYTNVLVGFGLNQCNDDIAMRPYMILEDAEGSEITLYGGIVERSIGYIASEIQKKYLYAPGSAEYEYLQKIIETSSEAK